MNRKMMKGIQTKLFFALFTQLFLIGHCWETQKPSVEAKIYVSGENNNLHCQGNALITTNDSDRQLTAVEAPKQQRRRLKILVHTWTNTFSHLIFQTSIADVLADAGHEVVSFTKH